MNSAPKFVPCHVRQPAWLFATLGVLVMTAIALLVAIGAGGGNAAAAQALAFPSAVGAGLTAGAVWGRLWRRTYITRREAIVRGVIGFAAVGFAWPASFLVQSFGPGIGHAPTIAGMLAPLAFGALIGALGGLFATTAAAFIALTPGAARR